MISRKTREILADSIRFDGAWYQTYLQTIIASKKPNANKNKVYYQQNDVKKRDTSISSKRQNKIYMRIYLQGKLGWITVPEYSFKRGLLAWINQKHSQREIDQKKQRKK